MRLNKKLSIILLFTCAILFAENYYVSLNGDDNSSGLSTDQAWRHLDHAVSSNSPVGPGDSIIVLEGHYENEIRINFEKSGELNYPIVLKARGIVTYSGDGDFAKGAWPHGIFELGEISHWIIDGFNIEYARFWGIRIMSCHYITVQNCRTFMTGAGGIIALPKEGRGGEQWTNTNIFFYHNRVERAQAEMELPTGPKNGTGLNEALDIWDVDTFEVAYNVVCYSHKEGIDIKSGATNGSVHHNHVHHQNPGGVYKFGGNGIYNDGGWALCNNTDIYRNIVHDVRQGSGIVLADEKIFNGAHHNIHCWNNIIFNCRIGFSLGAGTKDFSVVNNTVVNSNYLGISAGGNDSAGYRMTDAIIRNNLVSTFSDEWHFAYKLTNIESGEMDHNFFIDRKSEVSVGAGAAGLNQHDNTISPLVDIYAAPDEFNFDPINASAPIVDAANPDLAPTTDFFGRARAGSGPDIGALEYNGTGANPPAAPSGLTAHPLGPNSVKLTWQDNSDDEFNFWIERKYKDAPYMMLNSTMPNAIEFVDSFSASNTEYTYRVRAFKFDGYSLSNEVTVNTLSGGNLALAKPLIASEDLPFPSRPSHLAVDGRYYSFWEPKGKPVSLIIDLGRIYSVKEVETTFWSNIYRPVEFSIEVGADTSNMIEIASGTDTIPTDTAKFPVGQDARYVSLQVPQYANAKSIWVNEIRVFEEADVTQLTGTAQLSILKRNITLTSIKNSPALELNIKKGAIVSAELYSLDGKRVMSIPNKELSAGNHKILFNKKPDMTLGHGFYVCKIAIQNREGKVWNYTNNFVFSKNE